MQLCQPVFHPLSWRRLEAVSPLRLQPLYLAFQFFSLSFGLLQF